MERNTIAEMKQILEAIEQGKNIQFTYDGINWNDADRSFHPYAPDFMHIKYRVTPEKKFRPFKGTKELDNAIAKHGSWLIGVHSGARYLITSYGNSSVRIDGDGYTMVSMLKDFKFLDGTPCGVEEDA